MRYNRHDFLCKTYNFFDEWRKLKFELYKITFVHCSEGENIL